MNISFAAAWRLSFISLLLLIMVRMAPPFSWAQTQFLFSYELGFQRRALLGEMLTWIFPSGMTQQNTYMVAAVLTLFSVAVLFLFVARGLSNLANGGILLVLFSFSVGLGTFIGNTGNLDAILLVLAIIALAIPKRSAGRIVAASLICATGALFHENMLPYFAPLVGVDVWLRNSGHATGKRILLSALPVIATGLSVLLLFAFGTHPFALAADLLANLEMRSLGFEIRPATLDPVLALPPEIAGNLDWVWSSEFYRFRLLAFGSVGLLMLGTFIWLIRRAMSHRSPLDQIAVIAAIISPLSLLFVAFDVSRFIAIALLNVFLVLTILSRTDMEFKARLPGVFTPLVLVILLVMQSHIGLRDLNSQEQYLSGFPGAIRAQSSWFSTP